MTGLKTLLLSAVAVAIPHIAAAEVQMTCWVPSNVGLSADARTYWTSERMAKALPDDTVLDGRADLSEKALTQLKEGEPERAPVGEEPYKFGGKLFYTRGNTDYEASAQFVGEDNIVIGSAHSLWKGGNMAKNIIFRQGYSKGGGEAYTIDRAAVLSHWTTIAENPVSLGKSQFDYAVMRTEEASKVGKYALAVSGAKLDEDVISTGYPDTKEDGEYMYRETVKVRVQAGNAYEVIPFLMDGFGASGGAWFNKVEEAYRAVSVLSVSNLDHAYGPVFTDDTVEMVQKVKSGC